MVTHSYPVSPFEGSLDDYSPITGMTSGYLDRKETQLSRESLYHYSSAFTHSKPLKRRLTHPKWSEVRMGL